MWVRVISRFKHPETGEYHGAGRKINLRRDLVQRYVDARCVEKIDPGKEPSENKAKVPSENKGAE